MTEAEIITLMLSGKMAFDRNHQQFDLALANHNGLGLLVTIASMLKDTLILPLAISASLMIASQKHEEAFRPDNFLVPLVLWGLFHTRVTLQPFSISVSRLRFGGENYE